MNKRQLECLAETLLHVHGLESDGWKFEWNTHKRSFGLCDYTKKRIYLSTFLYDNTHDKAKFIDTVKHEVAHALTPRCRHNWEWRRMARRLGAIPKASARVEKIDPLKGAKHVLINTMNGLNEIVRPYFRKPALRTYTRLKTCYVSGKPETIGCLEIVTIQEYKNMVK